MATQLSDIITLTRQRSNMENNYFCTDAELTSYINNSLAELYDVLSTKYEDYNLSTFQAILPNDGYSNTISIPSNLFKLRAVDFQCSQQGASTPLWYTLFEFQLTERNRGSNTINNILTPYGKLRLSFRLADTSIIVIPQIEAGGTYQIWYTPKYVPLVQLTDTLTIQMDTQAWVEYAVVDCCVKIFNKQNMDPTGFMAEKAALLTRITGAARNRDSAGPKRVANTRYDDGDMTFGFGYGFGGW